jgi:GntR family histidine utilization transcriptional repressor
MQAARSRRRLATLAEPAAALALDGDGPLYEQIKRAIAGKVMAGLWRPGDRIPTELDLVERCGVSRMTVNRALRELAADGMIVREQGVGSFVAEAKPQSALLEIRNIRLEVLERGHSYRCRVIHLREERASPEIALAVRLAPGAPVFHSLLLHLEDDLPIAMEERHVNPAFAPHYIEQDFTKLTPYEYLDELGPLDAAEHIIEAVNPERDAQRLLDISAAAPCLRLTRRTWSNGLVVSRARLLYPGERYRLVGLQDYTAKA